MAAPDAGVLSPGKIFHGHYEVVRCISTGAMGAVYEVVDQKTHRRRALKVMLPNLVSNAEMRERFKLEATVTANVHSEHIVETFDADVDAETGSPFLVMELLLGDDLANLLGDRGTFKPSEIVLVLSQAARALDKTHAAGIVHRDLKPENIFITERDDGTPRVKILDFGIAKVLASSQTTPGVKQHTINLGTPPYMSPEQVLGEVTIDHRADIYALAHIAYALLVGEPYWLEDSRKHESSLYTLLLRIVDGAKEPPSVRAQRYGVKLSPAFDQWFFKATAPNPAHRFARASDLVLALADVLGVRLDTRPMTASGADWELDSVLLSRTGVMRLASGVSSKQGGPSSARPNSPPMSAAPPMGPAPRPLDERPQKFHAPTPAAMATPAGLQQRPKKSNRNTALAVLLVAFVVGVGVAAIILVVTSAEGPRSASGGPSVATEGLVPTNVAPVAAGTTEPASATPQASASTVFAGEAAAPSDTSLPRASGTGRSSSPTGSPAPSTATTTGSTTKKTGTTTKKTGKYDPLREL